MGDLGKVWEAVDIVGEVLGEVGEDLGKVWGGSAGGLGEDFWKFLENVWVVLEDIWELLGKVWEFLKEIGKVLEEIWELLELGEFWEGFGGAWRGLESFCEFGSFWRSFGSFWRRFWGRLRKFWEFWRFWVRFGFWFLGLLALAAAAPCLGFAIPGWNLRAGATTHGVPAFHAAFSMEWDGFSMERDGFRMIPPFLCFPIPAPAPKNFHGSKHQKSGIPLECWTGIFRDSPVFSSWGLLFPMFLKSRVILGFSLPFFSLSGIILFTFPYFFETCDNLVFPYFF